MLLSAGLKSGRAPSAALRLALALAYAAKPARLGHPIGYARLFVEKLFRPAKSVFARRPDEALTVPDGLVDLGGEMTPERLLAAYRRGIFPWCHMGPVKWWSPSKRAVLFLEESRIEKNLRRLIRQGKYRVSFDEAFREVMEGCAEPRAGSYALTWISPRFMDAYARLHELGHAHSVEVWDEEGNLAGGLYGVACNGVFFTESQFARKRDTSKIAFVVLNRHLQHWGYRLNDGKDMTGHLAALGMRDIPRAEFEGILRENESAGLPPGPWRIDPELDVAGWKPEAAA